MSTKQIRALVDAVSAHAHANYETGGWDFVVECLTDDELVERIGDATTEAEAVANVARWARANDEQRREVTAEIF